jgi:23S rRNA (uracil1939-C5)-methyltransferase
MSTAGKCHMVTATDLDYRAQGVCRLDGKVIFVPGLIEGESALVELVSSGDRFQTAQIVRLTSKSLDRIKETIDFQSADMAHIHHQKRCLWQQKITEQTFMKIAGMNITAEPTITDGVDASYRQKSVFHVMDLPILTLGLFAPGNDGLKEVTQFILADDLTNRIVTIINEAKIALRTKEIRHVVIRTNGHDQAIVTLVCLDPSGSAVKAITKHLSEVKEIKGVMANVHNDTRVILKGDSICLAGLNALRLPVGHVDVIINDTAFFQINPPVAKMAYKLIEDAYKGVGRLIDAYAGVGAIGFALLDHVKHVTMIDASRSNVAAARESIQRHQLVGVDVIRGRLEQMTLPNADALVVDPPRNGLMPAFTESLLSSGISRIAYMSCDVKTLARDAKHLASKYDIERVYPIAMFPKTSSLETLVFFHRRVAR